MIPYQRITVRAFTMHAGWGMGDEPLGCGNLGDLDAVYADHPDYDTAWA